MIEAPSKNHGPREAAIAHLVLHHTAQPLEVSLDLLRFGRVSSHYVVDTNGDVYRLVDESRVAWHAGLSWWGDARGLNGTSIGIEIVNLDGNVHAYPTAQRDAVIELCRAILDRHPGITARNVVGHSDIAPRRKDDPGRLFFWRELAQAGVGLWPRLGDTVHAHVGEERMMRVLRRIGYPPAHRYGLRDGRYVLVEDDASGVTDIVDVTETDVIAAFQSRYRPAIANGWPDFVSLAIAESLLMQLDGADARA